jgi:hypothetical protein
MGNGDELKDILCGSSMMVIQVLAVVGTILAGVSLIASIVAVFRLLPGIPERIVSWMSFFSG